MTRIRARIHVRHGRGADCALMTWHATGPTSGARRSSAPRGQLRGVTVGRKRRALLGDDLRAEGDALVADRYRGRRPCDERPDLAARLPAERAPNRLVGPPGTLGFVMHNATPGRPARGLAELRTIVMHDTARVRRNRRSVALCIWDGAALRHPWGRFAGHPCPAAGARSPRAAWDAADFGCDAYRPPEKRLGRSPCAEPGPGEFGSETWILLERGRAEFPKGIRRWGLRSPEAAEADSPRTAERSEAQNQNYRPTQR
jgi:hypothetical protein